MKLQELITKYGIGFDCRWIERRGDNLAPDTLRHFQVTIIGTGPPERSFRMYVSQKRNIMAAPTLEAVLTSLAQNAYDFEPTRHSKREDQFLLWCAKMGHSVESRKAEKEFKVMRKQVNQLKRTIGTQAYNELIEYARSGLEEPA